jgi:hypothetical protein
LACIRSAELNHSYTDASLAARRSRNHLRCDAVLALDFLGRQSELKYQQVVIIAACERWIFST